jgi:5'-3' exonuclease
VKVHLVDGTYELFRAHFGAPPAQDDAGRPAGAVRGLVASLRSLLREPGVTHVAVAFDHVIESFRNDLFTGYKTGEGIEPELLAQFQPAEDAVAALGVVVWSMVEFEADDALATAAQRFRDDPAVEQVVICSPDKDLAQCVVGSRVVCHDRQRRAFRDEAGVVARFGVRPASIPDWLALVGDTADGIPGIPGWGEKSAAAVLARYEQIDAIPDDPRQWQLELRGRERLAASLAQRRGDAALYRRLATLRTDVPLKETLSDLAWRGTR